jgi:sugar phosphate isomerase/epimerase
LELGPQELKTELDRVELGVSAIVGSIQLLSPNRSEREAGVALDLSRLDLCRQLGAEGLIEVPIFGANPYPDMRPVLDNWTLERDLLVAQCKRIGVKAEAVGIPLLLEPLNRYETHFLNRIDQAADIIQRTGNRGVRIMPDFFHMNIEESSIPDALRAGGDRIGYIHLADSQRRQPGTGHTDFLAGFRALKQIGYDGFLVMECGFDGELESAIRSAAEGIRQWWAQA